MEYIPPGLVLLKLANTCNMSCTYCYWFKDVSVFERSKLIRQDVLDSFYKKLRRHIMRYKLSRFSVVLHGGEPLLAGKRRVEEILDQLNRMQIELEMRIKVFVQTNGLLIDDEWLDIFRSFNVEIGLSIDGPKEIHDQYRKDLLGRPTFEKVLSAIKLMQARDVPFGVLAVYEPAISAETLCRYFIDELGIKILDFLIPNVSHETTAIPAIRDFYADLFELWRHKYAALGVKMRFPENAYYSITQGVSRMQSFGYNTVNLFMIKPDGEMEAFDALHYLGYGFTKSNLNIMDNEIEDMCRDELWQEVYRSSLVLHPKCMDCKFKTPCGGGMITTRWSNMSRFDNPSIYCDQYYEIFSRITEELKMEELAAVALQ